VPKHTDKPHAGVQELLPLDDIVDGMLCLRGGDHRAVLEAQAVNFALKSEVEQEAIMAGYRAFLNSLTCPVQVVVRILASDVETYLEGLRQRSGGLASDTLRRLALDHETFVRRLSRERTLLERRFYVVVPAGLANTFEHGGLRWPWQREARTSAQNHEAASRQLGFRCDEIAAGLGSFGVVTRRLGTAELIELWSYFLGTGPAIAQAADAVGRPVVVGSGQPKVAAGV